MDPTFDLENESDSRIEIPQNKKKKLKNRQRTFLSHTGHEVGLISEFVVCVKGPISDPQ
jgi:hypothetical protein